MEYFRLEEVAAFVNGYAFSREKYKDRGIPIIRISDIDEEIKLGNCICYPEESLEKLKEYTVKKGSLLIALSGATTGKMGVFNSDRIAYLNQRICSIFSKDKNLLQEYLIFYLKNLKEIILKNSYGGAQPNISSKWLEKRVIGIPSLTEQKKIVVILDKLVTTINKKKKQINLLEELVKSRFIEMFGDPIKNEKGWEVKKWEKILKIINGKNQRKVESKNGKYDIFGSGGKIGKANDWLVKENSVLIGRKGSINKPIIVKEKIWNVDTVFGLEPNIEIINCDYLYYFCYFYDFERLNKAVTIPSLTKKDLLKIDIPIPPLVLQEKFVLIHKSINKLKFLYNLKRYIFINLLKKLIIEILFFLTFLIFSANMRLDIELAEREEKMKYHRRSIEQIISEYKEQFPILLLTGPRQVGKSTLFKELFREEYKYFSLDDPILKEQIINDPRLFLKNNPEKLIIDEIQYAPSIFPYLKMKVDENREDGMYLMTGSQAFVLMKNVSETLAGRVGILELQGTSLREQFNIEFNKPFIPNEEYISKREKNITEYTNLWQRIHRGYMPELVFNDKKKWEFFYSSYVQTYIERDVRDLINISDESKFLKFMISLASRSGELLNYGAVANEVGVSNETVKRWVSVLRTSRIIYLMEPYFNNHLKRVIKTPKIYFMDVGLLAYLTKWPTPETLANGAKAGNIFETFVVSEIIKSYLNAGIINPPVYFYRDKDKKEIDLIIEEAEKIYPIEIKMSASPDKEMVKNFSVLKGKIDKEIGTGIIICQYDNKVYLSEDILVLPIEYI